MDRTRLDGSQIFSWLLVGLALVLLWAILQPFWSALFLAAVLAGVFAGLAGSIWLSQALASLLYGVKTRDSFTYVSVPIILMLVTVVACLVPARRAAKLDPVKALRS